MAPKEDDGCDVDADVSDDGSVEIVFERKGDRNGNRDGATAEQQPSSSKRLKTAEHQLRTLAEVVVASASASSKSAVGGDNAKGKTMERVSIMGDRRCNKVVASACTVLHESRDVGYDHDQDHLISFIHTFIV